MKNPITRTKLQPELERYVVRFEVFLNYLIISAALACEAFLRLKSVPNYLYKPCGSAAYLPSEPSTCVSS